MWTGPRSATSSPALCGRILRKFCAASGLSHGAPTFVGRVELPSVLHGRHQLSCSLPNRAIAERTPPEPVDEFPSVSVHWRPVLSPHVHPLGGHAGGHTQSCLSEIIATFPALVTAAMNGPGCVAHIRHIIGAASRKASACSSARRLPDVRMKAWTPPAISAALSSARRLMFPSFERKTHCRLPSSASKSISEISDGKWSKRTSTRTPAVWSAARTAMPPRL